MCQKRIPLSLNFDKNLNQKPYNAPESLYFCSFSQIRNSINLVLLMFEVLIDLIMFH